MTLVETLQAAVGATQVGRIVPGIGIQQVTGGEVADGQKQGHEHGVVVARAEGVIDPAQDRAAGAVMPGAGLDQGLGHRHQQRRRHPLAGDITDAKGDVVAVEKEEVIEVAADLARRL